jgi:hypothetical protein
MTIASNVAVPNGVSWGRFGGAGLSQPVGGMLCWARFINQGFAK